jgi:hypothetical protein
MRKDPSGVYKESVLVGGPFEKPSSIGAKLPRVIPTVVPNLAFEGVLSSTEVSAFDSSIAPFISYL